MAEVLSWIFLGIGSCFCLAAVVGILRFPDVYTRFHAGTKCITAGSLLILAGAALQLGSGAATARLFLIALFFLGTNPIATHAIARASYRQGIAPPKVTVDDYRGYLARRRFGDREPEPRSLDHGEKQPQPDGDGD